MADLRVDGGPAFPGDALEWIGRAGCETLERAPKPGMTLRDYFAAKAVQGLLACPEQPQSGADMYARDAYAVADAMLKERAK